MASSTTLGILVCLLGGLARVDWVFIMDGIPLIVSNTRSQCYRNGVDWAIWES